MSQSYSSLDQDFFIKSRKLKTLGEGTFGTVALYDTPLGRYVIKATKVEDKSLGYPPDFLTETDILIKFRSLSTIVHLEAVFFDSLEKRGYLLLEYLDANLSAWAKNTTFHRRMKILPELISQIGDTLRIMHSFQFVHNDMKTNNILVREDSSGPHTGEVHFKLADFGKAYYVRDDRTIYGAIEKYRCPKHVNIYSSEYWSFFVVVMEVVLGGKRMVDEENVKAFYAKFMSGSSFRLREYLEKYLDQSSIDALPKIFWEFAKPITYDLEANLDHVLESIGEVGVIDPNKIRKIKRYMSKSEPRHDDLAKISPEFKARFRNYNLEKYFDRFTRLFNKFLNKLTIKLDKETLRRYAEVAFIIIVKSRATEYLVFSEQKLFLEYQRAFLMKLDYQINIM